MNYGPKTVTNGLVLCVDAADKNSYIGSGTTWTDVSGNGNNGTLTNGEFVPNSSDGYLGNLNNNYVVYSEVLLNQYLQFLF